MYPRNPPQRTSKSPLHASLQHDRLRRGAAQPRDAPAGHDGGKTATHPAPAASGWKSAPSTAASWTCPSAWPRNCAQHEPALRELIAAQLKRGKVEVRAGVEGAGARDGARALHAALLQRLAAVQDTVRSLAARRRAP